MTRLVIGIINYGIGNHASVKNSLKKLGFHCCVSSEPMELESCALLVLPGVGAFQPAMSALRRLGLDQFIIDWANRKRPILGICLGMQLLTQASSEGGGSSGLGLIPGEFVALKNNQWHIGWNSLDRVPRLLDDELFTSSYGHDFYFNHSYVYVGPPEFTVGLSMVDEVFASAIRRKNVVGVQFHPEKSQSDGRKLLQQLVLGLCNA